MDGIDWWELRGALTALADRCQAAYPGVAAELESLALAVETQHDAASEASEREASEAVAERSGE